MLTQLPKENAAPLKHRKVVVIGAGSVGTTYIYALMQTGLAGEIALLDIDAKRVEGEIMDLSHGLAFCSPVNIHAGDYSDCADAALIVITAGAKQAPGQTRLQLVQKNADIVSDICEKIKAQDSPATIIMVTNPVDTLTHVAINKLGWPRNRVLGSGTVLDSARFRYMLGEHCKIDTRSVHGYILGEHGDTELAAWSMTHIAGTSISEYCRICNACDYKAHHVEIAQRVRDSAYHIIDYKGSTYYAIGLSLVRISGAILRDENSVLTVSTLLQGEFGVDDVCLSVPCVVGSGGIVRIIGAVLPPDEQIAFEHSASTLRDIYNSIRH